MKPHADKKKLKVTYEKILSRTVQTFLRYVVMIVCTMIIEFQSLGQKDQVIFKFLKSQQL